MDGSEPLRYRMENGPEGPQIACVNTPNVRLRVRRGQTATRGALKRAAPGTIWLDGAFDGAPFHDHARRLYSMDHHAGCLRPITLSTCEQAATMLVLGMPLKEGDWTLVLNEPDLDAVLAAWVFLNHLDLLAREAMLLREAMPLVRLEGVIDVHGLGREVLAGLPDDVQARHLAGIEALMQPVRDARAAGEWASIDATEFTLRMLEAIDRQVMPEAERARLLDLQEAGRVALRGQKVALWVRSHLGVYEVEQHLAERYGRALGLLVLDAGEGRFTLRRTDAFLDAGLSRLYRVLNRRDPRARGEGNAWGGAEDIGGSPRGTGSGLSGEEVMDVVQRVFGARRTWWRRFRDWVRRGPRDRART